jgi:glutathione S-transferase
MDTSVSATGQNQQFFAQPQLLPQQPIGGWNIPQYALPPDPPPKKFYTFQRVNGNGGNGKGDGVPGPHKHNLEESDRVKKNSVIRWQAKIDKDVKKKVQVSLYSFGF